MFKTSVLNAIPKDEKITFSGISDRLVFNAMRQQGTETALKATRQFNKPKGSRSDATSSKSKTYCSFHKINGHDTKDCFTLKKKEKEDREKGKESANRSSHDSGDASSSDSETDSKGEKLGSTSNVKVSKSLMTRIQAYIGRESPEPKEQKVLQTVIILDSGASTHMTPQRDWFVPQSFKEINPPRLVHFGDESTVPATGIGNIILQQTIKGKLLEVTVLNVLFVPAFTLTLLSVRRFNFHIG